MKNFKLVNVVLVVIIGLSMLFVAKESLAATDLTNTLTGNTTSNNSSNIQTITGNNTISNNTTTNNSISNTTKNTTNNAVLTTNNTSTYNNTSLPKTGAGDVVPGIVIAVVLGISAVYAYNRIQYYKNI